MFAFFSPCFIKQENAPDVPFSRNAKNVYVIWKKYVKEFNYTVSLFIECLRSSFSSNNSINGIVFLIIYRLVFFKFYLLLQNGF